MHTLRAIIYHVFVPSSHPSPSHTPEPRKPSHGDHDFSRSRSSFRWRYFWIHFISLSLSGAVLATIVLVLRAFQNGPEPKLGGVKLYMLVAWLAAIAKLGITIPLAEVLGQIKWNLFMVKRKLSDLDLADAAGRDPVGALGWIFRFRGGLLLHFGAALVLVSLGFDPMLQHLMVFEPVVVEVPNSASISHNLNYAPLRGLDRGLIFSTPTSLLLGAYSSILGSGVPVSHSCPSGNCTLTSTTVGVCSSCADTTASLRRSCKDVSGGSGGGGVCRNERCLPSGQICNYTRDGVVAGGERRFLSLVGKGQNFKPDGGRSTISVSRDLITLDTVFITPTEDNNAAPGFPFPIPGYVASGADHRAQSFSCKLSYCEKRISTRITNGSVSESIKISPGGDRFVLPAVKLDDIDDELLARRLNLTAEKNSATISAAAMFALASGFAVSITGNSSVPETSNPSPGQISEPHQALYQLLLRRQFPEIMEGMVQSMTNAIRNTGPEPLPGTLLETQIHLHVRWRWFALPAIVWAGTLLLLVGVSLNAKNARRVWLGTSQLALAMIGLETEARRECDLRSGSRVDRKAMREVGERVRCRVGEGVGGRRELTRAEED